MHSLRHEPCCFCGGEDYVLVNQQGPRCLQGDFRHVPGFIKNLGCTGCGLIVNRFKMNDQLASFYDAYTKKSADDEEDDLLFSANAVETLTANQADFLVGCLSLPEEGKILDIGCGKGALLDAFRRHRAAWQFHGIDPSAQEVALARRKPYLDIRKGLFGETELGSAHFDLVTITHVLEHMPDPNVTLRQINACLMSGGHVFIEVPNPLDLNMFYDFLLYEHLYHFAPETLAAMLRQNGLEPVHVMASTSYGAQRVIARKVAEPAGGRPSGPSLDRSVIADGISRWHALWDGVCDLTLEIAADTRARGRRLGIFGAGMTSAALLTYTCLGDLPLVGLFDESPYKIGKTLLGQPIHALADLARFRLDALVIATMPSTQDLVWSKLQKAREQGIRLHRLCVPSSASAAAA